MKTVEIIEGPRAQTYDQSIRIWVSGRWNREHSKFAIPHFPRRLAELVEEAGFGKLHIFMQSLIFGGWIATKIN